jgi:hypothetical protein
MIGAATSITGGFSAVPLHRLRVIENATIARNFAADSLQMQPTAPQKFNLKLPPESRER